MAVYMHIAEKSCNFAGRKETHINEKENEKQVFSSFISSSRSFAYCM